jgi:hypothetical protein
VYPKGGYRLISAGHFVMALDAANSGVISFSALRAYLGCFELLARREGAKCLSQPANKPWQQRFTLRELSSLLNLSTRHTAGALSKLRAAGLLTFSEDAIQVLPVEEEAASHLLGGRKVTRRIPVPRRLLRFLCRCKRASLVKTVLAYLIRGLSLTREHGFNPAGTIKISWICTLCGLSERAARSARAELIRLGWITRDEGSSQWKLNRDGTYFRINLSWGGEKTGEGEGRGEVRSELEIAPRGPSNCAEIAPPIGKQGSLIRSKNQNLVLEAVSRPSVRYERQRKDPAPGSGVCGANGEERKSVCSLSVTGVVAKFQKTAPRKPNLKNIQPEDLRRFSTLKELHAQATRAGWLPPGEAGLQNFVAAAARAMRVKGDSVRIFVGIVRRGLWHHLAQADEDRARAALRSEREPGHCANAVPRRMDQTHSASSDAGLKRAGESLLSCISYIRYAPKHPAAFSQVGELTHDVVGEQRA